MQDEFAQLVAHLHRQRLFRLVEQHLLHESHDRKCAVAEWRNVEEPGYTSGTVEDAGQLERLGVGIGGFLLLPPAPEAQTISERALSVVDDNAIRIVNRLRTLTVDGIVDGLPDFH